MGDDGEAGRRDDARKETWYGGDYAETFFYDGFLDLFTCCLGYRGGGDIPNTEVCAVRGSQTLQR